MDHGVICIILLFVVFVFTDSSILHSLLQPSSAQLSQAPRGLVSVFRLSSDCVAIVNGDVVTSDDRGTAPTGYGLKVNLWGLQLGSSFLRTPTHKGCFRMF